MDSPTPIFEAIALQKCLKATYNKMVVTLAPHILYTRHDEMFMDAVTTDRDGHPPRELKLGTFKLAGLSDVEILDETFEAMHRSALGDGRDVCSVAEAVTVVAQIQELRHWRDG